MPFVTLGLPNHDVLPGVSANDHHTPTVAGDLNHQDLANRGASDHHVATVAGDLNLNDLAEKSHDNLTGVSTNDHLAVPNQGEYESESTAQRAFNASLCRHIPGVAKLGVSITSTGATEGTLYNVASVTDTGTGDRTVVVDDDFNAIVDSRWIATAFDASAEGLQWNFSARAVGSARHTTWIGAVVLTDIATAVTAYGIQV